jgi:hypothetical protein
MATVQRKCDLRERFDIITEGINAIMDLVQRICRKVGA